MKTIVMDFTGKCFICGRAQQDFRNLISSVITEEEGQTNQSIQQVTKRIDASVEAFRIKLEGVLQSVAESPNLNFTVKTVKTDLPTFRGMVPRVDDILAFHRRELHMQGGEDEEGDADEGGDEDDKGDEDDVKLEDIVNRMNDLVIATQSGNIDAEIYRMICPKEYAEKEKAIEEQTRSSNLVELEKALLKELALVEKEIVEYYDLYGKRVHQEEGHSLYEGSSGDGWSGHEVLWVYEGLGYMMGKGHPENCCDESLVVKVVKVINLCDICENILSDAADTS